MTERQRAEEILKDNLNESLIVFINTYPVAYKSEIMLKDWILDAMLEFRNEGLRDELIKTLNWISDKECPYAIMYGNTTHRFATIEKDYTTEQIVEKLIEYLKTK